MEIAIEIGKLWHFFYLFLTSLRQSTCVYNFLVDVSCDFLSDITEHFGHCYANVARMFLSTTHMLVTRFNLYYECKTVNC